MILVVIIVLLFWALWFLGPYIRRWLMRRSMRYVQDRVFRSMGIDPQQTRMQQEQTQKRTNRRNTRARRRHTGGTGKIIPPDYGVSIDYVQMELEGTERWLQDTALSPVFKEYRNETQITDVQYTLIS